MDSATASTPASTTPKDRWRVPLLLLGSSVSIGICVDMVRLAWLGKQAPFAHLVSLPSLALWCVLGVLAVIAAGVGLLSMLSSKLNPKLVRLPLLAAVVVIFIDAFMVDAVRAPPPMLDLMMPLEIFAHEVGTKSSDTALVSDADELQQIVHALPGPSLLERGLRVEHWRLLIRQHCTGPIDSAPGVTPGTYLFCLADDGKRGWVSEVVLDSTFGAAEVAHWNGKLLARLVVPTVDEDLNIDEDGGE